MSAAVQKVGPKGLLGVEVQLGGRAWVLPPLNAKRAKQYWPRLDAMQKGEEADPLGLVSELVQICLQRNHDDVPEDLAADFVDMDNFDMLAAAVMGQKAFVAWCEQQAAAKNPALPNPTTAAAGTGEPSTPASPPSPGGAGPTSTS